MQFDGIKDAAAIIATAKTLDEEFQLTEADLGQLLGWLSRGGLLSSAQSKSSSHVESAPISSRIIWDPLGARFPLIRGQYVEKLARAFQPIVSFQAAIGVFVLAIVAFATVLFNWTNYIDYTSKLFVAEGRVWWIVAWLLLKVVHELGHAVTAVHAGSRIRSAGISFFFFAPVPYIDGF